MFRWLLVISTLAGMLTCPFDCLARAWAGHDAAHFAPAKPACRCCAARAAKSLDTAVGHTSAARDPIPAPPDDAADEGCCLCDGAVIDSVYRTGFEPLAAIEPFALVAVANDDLSVTPHAAEGQGPNGLLPHASGLQARLLLRSLLL